LKEIYGEKGLYEGGLIVRSTMVPAYQAAAEKALRNGLVAYDMRHGLHSTAVAQIDLKAAGEDWQAELAKVAPPPGAGDFVLALVLETGDRAAQIGMKDGARGVITYNKMRWASRRGAAPNKVSD